MRAPSRSRPVPPVFIRISEWIEDPQLRDVAIPLIHLQMQDKCAEPSRGPRDDTECHRRYFYTFDYEHADSEHDRQTLHHQCTEV